MRHDNQDPLGGLSWRCSNATSTPHFVGGRPGMVTRPKCGTSLADLECSKVIDLLPDQEAATLPAWLQQ